MSGLPGSSHVFGCVVCVGLALVTAACTGEPRARTPDQAAAQPRAVDLPPPEVGEVRRVFGMATPFPEGEWSAVGEIAAPGSPADPQRSEIWASQAAGVVDRLVVVSEQSGPQRDRSSAPCDDADDAFAAPTRGAGDGQACWHIRAVSLRLAADAPAQNQLVARHAEQNDLVLSPTMISVRYHFSDGATRRSIEYLYSPDLLAPAPGDRLWTAQDWSRTAVMADPRRRAVVSALEEWGARWSTVVVPPLAAGA